MSVFSIGRYDFCPKIRWICLTILGMAILSSLGIWQIHRAEEKRQMLKHYAVMQEAEPVSVISLKAGGKLSVKNYQRVSAEGVYDNQHVFFLDNQFYRHQLGYEVIVPFVLDNGKVVFISRGWIKAPLDRKQLPAAAPLEGRQSIRGTVYFPSASMFLGTNVIDNADDSIKTGSRRIEKILIQEMGLWIQKPVYPFLLRLDKNQPGSLICDWPVVVMKPERHIGYAVQWFLMALALLVFFVVLNTKKR